MGGPVRGAAARRRARPRLGRGAPLPLGTPLHAALERPARPRGGRRRPMSATVGDTAFDVCGPLPAGVTVLEASAGTGKTYTIAGLTARYVAEGMALDELLVMTFTRNATAELRDRVRRRLVSAERGLDRVLSGAPVDEDDEVLALLARGTQEQVEARRRNLAAAVADFDAATIVT